MSKGQRAGKIGRGDVAGHTAARLGALGFKAVEADCGEAASRLMAAGAVTDLLISDHPLPGLTGIELDCALGCRVAV